MGEAEATKVAESSEKTVAPPLAVEKGDVQKAAVIPFKSTSMTGSVARDAALSRIENEKRMNIIKAWEESQKAKAENKSQKEMASILAWENSKKASIEAELKRIQEKLEKKKAEYAEKMKNKMAMIRKEAEEKRAMVEAKRNESLLKAEEDAAKFRAQGQVPKKSLGCCSA